jgi:hypothetical protein
MIIAPPGGLWAAKSIVLRIPPERFVMLMEAVLGVPADDAGRGLPLGNA